MPPSIHRSAVRSGALVALAAAGLLSSGVAADATGTKPSSTTIMSTERANYPHAGMQPVLGNVSPDRPGEKVLVKYYKRSSGSWVLKAKKSAAIDSGPTGPGSFFLEVPAVNRGTCKIVAKYAGDATYAASHVTRVVGCATGEVKS